MQPSLGATLKVWNLPVRLLHRTLFVAVLLALAAVHVAGVLFTSLRQPENLVLAMLTGRKAGAREGDGEIDGQRGLTA